MGEMRERKREREKERKRGRQERQVRGRKVRGRKARGRRWDEVLRYLPAEVREGTQTAAAWESVRGVGSYR
jgi:hypothetical protein